MHLSISMSISLSIGQIPLSFRTEWPRVRTTGHISVAPLQAEAEKKYRKIRIFMALFIRKSSTRSQWVGGGYSGFLFF